MSKKKTEKVKPIKKKSVESTELDFLELENRIEHLERALAEGLENINVCMQHVLEMSPKIKKCSERLGLES
jgi:ribosome assembly protein YihI (activator of Der GTPase)